MRRTTRVGIILEFAGDDRGVAEYIASEVLDALPDSLCDFLVRTSVSDEVCASSSMPSSEAAAALTSWPNSNDATAS